MTSPRQPPETDPAAREAIDTRLPANVLALGLVALFNDSAGDMIHPLLPAFVGAVGGGPQALGLIEGIADATSSLVQLGSGYLADRVGRLKAATTVGYAVAVVARPLLALAQTWWQILGVRFGDRIGKGIRSAPRDALLADATPIASRGRAYGFHRAMDNAGAMVGPAVAWLMLSGGLSMREVFAWSAIPGLLTLAILQIMVADAAFGRFAHKESAGLPPSAAYRRLLVAIFVFTLGCSSDAFLLWRAAELGIANSLAPILWMVLSAVKAATSTWGGALSDRAGRRKVIIAGWAVYAATYLGFAFANAGWQVWLLFAVYGTFFGLTEGTEKALVVDLVEPQWRGRALGTYHAAVGIASLPASVVFGVLYQAAGPMVAFSTGAGLAIIAITILARQAQGDRAAQQ
ncbi:MAG: MFS transporter [Candidatus Binataceae bacterium]